MLVRLKPGILDVQGAAVQRVDEMCRKLLANTILEDYTVEAIEGERLAASEPVR